MVELDKYMNRVLIPNEDIIELVKTLNDLGFKLNLFVSVYDNSFVLSDEIEYLNFKKAIEVYRYLTPVIERAKNIVDRAEKEKRLLRNLLIDQINLVSSRFGKEVYTFSLGEVEKNG